MNEWMIKGFKPSLGSSMDDFHGLLHDFYGFHGGLAILKQTAFSEMG